MILQKIDIRTCSDEWNNYILSSPNSVAVDYSIAHNPSLFECIEKVLKCKSEYYYLIENEKIIGLLPGFRIDGKFISMPIFPTAGIFAHNAAKLEEWYSDVVELLPDYEIRSNLKFGKYVYDKKVLCHLPLKGNPDLQWKNLKSKVRNRINKGYEQGIKIKFGGKELLNEFYYIYSFNMRHLGSPVLDKNFFINLIDNYKNGIAKIFISYFNNIPVGGSFVLSYNNLLEAGWVSTLSNYNRFNPNVVLYWEMIKFSSENGMKYFSFGRSTKGSGAHKFKLQWDVVEVPIFFNYSNYTFDIRRLKILSFLWRKLPLDITNKIGPLLRRFTKI